MSNAKLESIFNSLTLSNTNTHEQMTIKSHSNDRSKNKPLNDVCNKNCRSISRVSSARYLGVIFDEHLKWKPHIKTVVIRLKKYFHIFIELKNILVTQYLKMVYLVLAIIIYCISVWGSVYQNVLLKP